MGKIMYIGVVIILVGIIIWMGTHRTVNGGQTDLVAQEKRYPLLSKRILQEYPADLLINFRKLRKDLREVTDPYNEEFGLYFEYLPTGTSIGVREKDEFTSASLLKVPIVMAYYHMNARLGKKDNVVTTIKEEDINKSYGNLWKRGVGAKISINEAIKLALTESDNTAASVIARQFSTDDYLAISEGLDIELHEQKETPVITLKQYSSILKSLFFAASVSKEDSEMILDHLSNSTFTDKLPAGVGDNVTVAHKVGVLEDKLYTDCGIIYMPRRPYILCMVSASTDEVAKERMKQVSKTVYDFLKDASVSP